MRICYVAWRARGEDGWGRYTVEVAREMLALGAEPVLVTAEPERDSALDGIEGHAILPPLFSRRWETPRSLLRARRLRRILATCDVVHCTVEPYAPLVAAACPRGLPYVQTAHGSWAIRPLESARQRLFFAPAFRRVDRLVFQSRFTRDRMARLLRLPPHAVLTGGVRPEAFEQPAGVALPAWADRHPVVLSVGALKARKGHHVALEAVALARRSLPNLRYVVLGGSGAPPAYGERLQARARALGIADRVHLLGRVGFEGLVAWYQRARVFTLLPVSQGSSFEGFGLVYLEAGAAGTPSVGTRECGAGEAVVDGETGLLVPQDDPRAAAEALLGLLLGDDLRARMGAAARARARELSWAALARRLSALYAELARGHGR